MVMSCCGLLSTYLLCFWCVFTLRYHLTVLAQSENGDIRLVGGDTIFEGNVEIYYEGSWGVVCDDSWDVNDAQVVCRALGYGSVIAAHSEAYYGNPTHNLIWLDDVQCNGWQSALADCAHNGWGTHNCAVSEAAGVQCAQPGSTQAPSEASPAYIGCFSYNSPGDDTALSIDGGEHSGMTLQSCQRRCLDFGTDIIYAGLQNGIQCFCDDISTTFFTRTQQEDDTCQTPCGGNANDEYCGGYFYIAVYDLRRPSTLIRLVGSSQTNSGRVELFHNNAWSSVCSDDWGMSNTEVACRMAGFQGATSFHTDGRDGEGTGRIILDNVVCNGDEDTLFECQHPGLYQHNCLHQSDVGVVCNPFGGIRLTGGDSDNEGIVEITYDGIWRTLCHSWGVEERQVVCRELGYYGSKEVGKEERDFSPGLSSFGWYGFDCSGTETSLSQCFDSSYTFNIRHYCDEKETVICQPLEDGVVRLVGGDSIFEGNVEIYYDGSWGAVCDDSWDTADAEVVCHQLGYGPVTEIHSDTFYGSSTDSFWLDDLECSGDEAELSDCFHPGWGSHNCGSSEVAGVQCMESTTTTSGSSGLSTAEVIGVAIGVAFVICLLYVFHKQKQLRLRLKRDVGFVETCQFIMCSKHMEETSAAPNTQELSNENTTLQTFVSEPLPPENHLTTNSQPDQPPCYNNTTVYPTVSVAPSPYNPNYYPSGVHGFPSTNMSTPQTYSSNLPPLNYNDIYQDTTDFSIIPPPPSYEVATKSAAFDLPQISH